MKKESRLLRVGVLGCGPISQIAHFDACRKARNAMLYAVCDAAEDLVAHAMATHEPKVAYHKFDDMLADPQVEAVIIGVADQFHVALARQAVAAGKHILVEKPLGVSIEECEALRGDLKNTRLVLQVGNNRRFDPGVAFARKFIGEEMGPMLALKAWYYDSIFRYTMTDNLQPIVRASAQARRPERNPKADQRRYFMLGHGSHLADTARFLGGEITAVRARLREDPGAFCWFVETDFASGALGHLDLIIPIRGEFEEGFQIFGQHGSVRGRVLLPWFHKAAEVECFSAKDRQYRRPLGEDAHTYKLQIEGFADTILHDAPQHGANIEDGLAAVRTMTAMARSVETGQKIRLAEVTGAV
jgi:predicted dehydrogenase